MALALLWLGDRCKKITNPFLLRILTSNTRRSFRLFENRENNQMLLEKILILSRLELRGLSALIKHMGNKAQENDKLSIPMINFGDN